MAYGNQVLEYRKNAVLGASPVGLVVMLYDGALRFMEQGRIAMIDKNLEVQNQSLQKAQRIILELMATLNMDEGGEISKNLMSLYTFVLERLVMANVNDDPEPITHAQKLLSELRESWVELDARVRRGPTEAVVAA